MFLGVKDRPSISPDSESVADWRDLDLALHWCHEALPAAPESRQTGVNLIVWRMLEGTIRVEAGGLTARGRPGDWLVCTPVPRRQFFSSSARLLSVHIVVSLSGGTAGWVGPAMARLGPDAGLDAAMARLRATPVLRDLPPDQRRILSREAMPLGRALALRAELTVFFAELLRRTERIGLTFSPVRVHDARVRESHRFLAQAGFRDAWTRESLAAAQGVSASRLDRLWRRELGRTPRRFWDERLLAAARERLQRDDRPVKELAYDLGFTSAVRFSQWFKQHQGESPRAFRAHGPGA